MNKIKVTTESLTRQHVEKDQYLSVSDSHGNFCHNFSRQFDLIDAYEDLYDLPRLNNEQRWAEGEPARDFTNFLVLLLCKNRRVFIRYHPFGSELPWVPLGEKESILCPLASLAKTYVPGITLGEISPVACIQNHFLIGHELFATQHGLAVLVKARGNIGFQESGLFLPVAMACKSPRLSKLQRRILQITAERLNAVHIAAPEEEMEAAENHRFQTWLHQKIVRKLVDPFSSARLREKILAYFGSSESFLDVSCGDDRLLLDVAERASFCVGNDVSLALLQSLTEKRKRSNIILTVHNALELPFRKRFEFVLVKNTLHHLRSGEIRRLFDVLRRISSRILFVDIVNLSSCRKARMWNLYYRRWLGDQGGAFLTEEQFHCLIAAGFPDREIAFDYMDTLKGRYAFALVSPASR